MQSNDSKCTRRSFIKGAATGALALGGLSLAACSSETGGTRQDDRQWDKETDVVVVGYGYGGACAAISAKDAGADVIVVEKAPEGGGNSATCVGMIHTAISVSDPDAWKQSRRELLLGSVPDETVNAFVDKQLEIQSWLEDDLGTDLSWTPKPVENQDLATDMAQIIVDGKPGNGHDLFAFFANEVDSRGIEVLLSTPATSLIQDPETKEIIGVTVSQDGNNLNIKARKGVMLSCGGYENNPEMQSNHNMPGIQLLPWGTPYNTGDGHKMAKAVGADMWHYPCFEYAGLAPRKPFEEEEGSPVFTLNYNSLNMSVVSEAGNFVIVNTAGQRFYDEHTKISHQKTTLPFGDYNEAKADYVNYPFFFVCDDTRAKEGPLAPTPLYNGNSPYTYQAFHSDYEWSKDNSAEVEKGWIDKADTLEELAEKLGIDPEGLVATVTEYNRFAEAGKDDQFDRPAETMAPVATPPFYGCECRIIIINTMGGAVRNENSQVLDPFGNPIPRLYSAGEFGSYNGSVQYTIGNVAEAITSGRVGGLHAASLDAWEAQEA